MFTPYPARRMHLDRNAIGKQLPSRKVSCPPLCCNSSGNTLVLVLKTAVCILHGLCSEKSVDITTWSVKLTVPQLHDYPPFIFLYFMYGLMDTLNQD